MNTDTRLNRNANWHDALFLKMFSFDALPAICGGSLGFGEAR